MVPPKTIYFKDKVWESVVFYQYSPIHILRNLLFSVLTGVSALAAYCLYTNRVASTAFSPAVDRSIIRYMILQEKAMPYFKINYPNWDVFNRAVAHAAACVGCSRRVEAGSSSSKFIQKEKANKHTKRLTNTIDS